MSELVGTRVLVMPGRDMVGRACGRTHKDRPCAHCGHPFRVVCSARDYTTGQEKVVVEGPEPGSFTIYSLADFHTRFGPAGQPPTEKVLVHKEGSGF